MLYAALALLLVALDQGVKFLVRTYLPLGSGMPFIPHVLELTYVQNTGAAFSLFAEHTWVLTIISAVMTLALAVALFRRVFKTRAGNVILAVLLAGAAGNLIDRAVFGFVTDMFATTFINFAVFNVADICVVLGGIALCVYVMAFHDKSEKKL